MALAYSTLKEEKYWSSDTVDEVLISGDQFYNTCVRILKGKGKFYHPMLMVDELARKLKLQDKELELEIDDCLVNGVITADDNSGLLSLRKGFQEFFKDNDTGVLTARSMSVAIWKKDETYYYYDSHGRNEMGVVSCGGTACILRILNLDELTKSVETNFGPSQSAEYNIGRVVVKVWEMVEEGPARPPRNNYKEINQTTAILQSQHHESSRVFKLNAGKQSVPMCLIALGMTKLFTPDIWSTHLLDQILKQGDAYYFTCMTQLENDGLLYVRGEDGEGLVESSVNSENVLKTFKIGINRVDVEFQEGMTGNFEENLQTNLEEYFAEDPDDPNKEYNPLLLESVPLKMVIWKRAGLFYTFDPKPRDNAGQVFGKDEWSAKVEPIQIKQESDEESGDGDAGPAKGIGDGDKVSIEDSEMEIKQEPGVEDVVDEEAEARKQEKLERQRFWDGEANEKGHACSMWFTGLDQLVQHLVENTPPNSRAQLNFTLKPVEIRNKPEVAEVYDPKVAPRTDSYSGDWFDFKEVNKGKWILRGTIHQGNEMFPKQNRDMQAVANCLTALAFVKLYALPKFKPVIVNSILKYGDKLLTFTKNMRKNALKNDKAMGLTPEEIEMLVAQEEYRVEDYPRGFCISEHKALVDLEVDCVEGHIHANDMEGVLDVLRGLEYFFETSKHCILTAKGIHVAVWKGAKVFYMFDSHPRGPSGRLSPSGVACITRYLNLENLVDVFLGNLPQVGSNTFKIHKVEMTTDKCERLREPEVKQEKVEKPVLIGFADVSPGKRVLRGTISQEEKKFDKAKNALCAPIAIVALTMTLIHKCAAWTTPIIDEIITLGNELYATSVDSLGYGFNPWEQQMTTELVQKDFYVGRVKANFELRRTDQRGVIDIKSSHIPNLRQGIEHFFEENTHGILQTETLTVAIWENEEDNLIYVLDPNPRGKTGMPAPYGAACLMTFANAKMASDHVISCIGDKHLGDFIITPVEIVVGRARTKKKPRSKASEEMEQKRKMRLEAEQARQKEEEKRVMKIGRLKYDIVSDEVSILRGTRSQASPCWSAGSRNNQDIPNCLAAYVLHRLQSIDVWHYKHIDTILSVGEQLYVDSYICYKPKDVKLGLNNVVRSFCIRDCQVNVEIFKPAIKQALLLSNLRTAFSNWFQQESCAMLGAYNKWVTIILKGGMYYLFDPHDHDHEGKKTPYGKGCAVVMRYETIHSLADGVLMYMIDNPNDPIGNFQMVLLSVKEIKKLPKKMD